jgi:hypothetical protein
MGLVMGEVRFPGEPPGLEEIAARVTARSGLGVVAEPFPNPDGFYQVYGQLSFPCAPETAVELFCYSPAQRRRNVEMFVESGLVSPEARRAPLPAGSVVHLRSIIGVEMTLFIQAELALEELGGTLHEPPSEEMRQEYGGSLTEAELLRRIRDMEVAMRPALWATVLLLPLLLPIQLVWTLVRLPWTLWKARQLLRERGGFPFSLSDQEDISEGIRLPHRRRPPPSTDPS